MKLRPSKRAAMRARIKSMLVEAGMQGIASRRTIRAILILLGLELV